MAGTLSIVATPIGHLDDITLRALNVLRTANVIAAEDTRRTARLLTHHAIETPSVSFHEHNVRSRLPQLLKRLTEGQSIALVSDAGTPLLSDPGLELVQACLANGIAVDPVPGASAPLALAVVSGWPLELWTIAGFAPHRSLARIKWLNALAGLPGSVTFFETPHRIQQTLADLAVLFGKRQMVVGREMTKVHQTFYRGTAADLAQLDIDARGEFTIMLAPHQPDADVQAPPEDEALAAEFGEITELVGGSRRAAVKELARRHGLSTKIVYSAVERAKSR